MRTMVFRAIGLLQIFLTFFLGALGASRAQGAPPDPLPGPDAVASAEETVGTPTFRAPACPDGYKCIPDGEAHVIAGILESHHCLQTALEAGDVDMTWKPLDIVTTHEGAYTFYDDELQGTIVWCDFEMDVRAKVDVRITQMSKDEPKMGFRLRIKLAMVADLDDWVRGASDWQEALYPAVALETFFWRAFHVQVHGGLRDAGASLGVDVTKNLGAFLGMGVGWADFEAKPVVGLAVSLN